MGDLLRLAARDGEVVPDLRRRLPGRGVHLCPRPECVRRALKRRPFGRRLRTAVRVDEDRLLEQLHTELRDGLERLLEDGKRSGDVVEVPPDRMWPPSLRALRRRLETDGASDPPPAVAVRHPRLARRVACRASALERFTSTRAGGMNLRPLRGGSSASRPAYERTDQNG